MIPKRKASARPKMVKKLPELNIRVPERLTVPKRLRLGKRPNQQLRSADWSSEWSAPLLAQICFISNVLFYVLCFISDVFSYVLFLMFFLYVCFPMFFHMFFSNVFHMFFFRCFSYVFFRCFLYVFF